jgi:hypothetical protein
VLRASSSALRDADLGKNGIGPIAQGKGHVVEFGNRKSEKELLITDLEKK